MTARWGTSGVIVLAATMLLIGLGSVPLLDPDESRFAQTSVEMLQDQDLVVPHFEGRPRLVKPPLWHWIQAALFSALGVSEWVARLPAALATLVSILLVSWIGSRRFGDEGGIWAALTLSTMPIVIALGHVGTLDALLAVHVLAIVAPDIGGIGGAREERPEPGYGGLALGALAGLAFLAKGPVGLVLPVLILLAGRTAAGRETLPSWRGLLHVVAGAAAVILPWSLTLARRVGVESAMGLLGEELNRSVEGTSHPESPFFYLFALPALLLPWTATVLLGGWRAWKLRRASSSATARYCAAALGVGVAFFSLFGTKQPQYLLPLLPFAALLATWEIGAQLGEAERSRVAAWISLATLPAGCGVLGLAAFRLDAESYRGVAAFGAVLFGAGAVIGALGLARRQVRWVHGSAVGATALFLMLVAARVLPGVAETRTAAYLVDAVPELASGTPVVVLDMKVPSLTFYLGRPPESVDMHQVEERLGRGDTPLVVVDEDDLPDVPVTVTPRLEEIGRQGKYVVYRVDAAGEPRSP